jgi:NAD(P)-dependent dehydrogenase (short-subunit alcohol dehydrogenase family)
VTAGNVTARHVAAARAPELAGQTVVLIGGSSGIGLETARRARTEGAGVILVGRNQDRLDQAARELGAERTAAFDATDEAALASFFRDLPDRVDHVMVTGGGPSYSPILEMDSATVSRDLSDHARLMVSVARNAVGRVRPGGALLFMGGADNRVVAGIGIFAAAAAALPPLTATLALEVAPIRVNLIAAGFVDTPLSATLLGDDLDKRRQQLRSTLPIGRVVGPADVAALAVHLMANTAITGETYNIDGGQRLVS